MAVTHELRCAGCRHMLRGQSVMGRCGECGMLVMTTLVETLDMPSQSIARPVHARRISIAFFAISIGILIWIVAVVAPMLLRGFAELGRVPLPTSGGPADQLAVTIAFLGALIFTIGAIQIARRDDPILRVEIGNHDRILLLGIGIWFGAATVSLAGVIFDLQAVFQLPNGALWFMCLAVQLLGAMVAAIGLHRFATVLGRRCRQFRHAGHARQSLETMVITGAISLVSSFSAAILPGLGYVDLPLFLVILSFITGALLILGGIYLVMNFWWIYRILNNPPPNLREVVDVIGLMNKGESSN